VIQRGPETNNVPETFDCFRYLAVKMLGVITKVPLMRLTLKMKWGNW
jgi:hypothetical protein